MKEKIFYATKHGIAINDIDKALELAHDAKYYDKRFDINLDSLNKVYNHSSDELAALLNFYVIGKFQGIKQGIAHQKEIKQK